MRSWPGEGWSRFPAPHRRWSRKSRPSSVPIGQPWRRHWPLKERRCSVPKAKGPQQYSERNEVEGQLERLAQERAKQTHRQALLELRASQDGVVKDIATHTAGTVVQPGTVLMTLVPKGEALKAEVWVSNQDIGFVHD